MTTRYMLKAQGFSTYKDVSKTAFKKVLSICQKSGQTFHVYRSSLGGQQIRKLHI